MIIETDNKKW